MNLWRRLHRTSAVHLPACCAPNRPRKTEGATLAIEPRPD